MKALSQATIFYVTDLMVSFDFYTKKLGFEKDFIYGDPAYYAAIKMNDVVIHLCKPNCCPGKIGQGAIYIFCDSVDDYFEKVKIEKVNFKKELESQSHGMRSFMLTDPDGNCVTFGTKI